MAGFSISGPLYLVINALATGSPETASSSSSLKRNFLVLWLIFSTLSNTKLMKPWSPPLKHLMGSMPVPAPVFAGTLLSSVLLAGWPCAPDSCCAPCCSSSLAGLRPRV